MFICYLSYVQQLNKNGNASTGILLWHFAKQTNLGMGKEIIYKWVEQRQTDRYIYIMNREIILLFISFVHVTYVTANEIKLYWFCSSAFREIQKWYIYFIAWDNYNNNNETEHINMNVYNYKYDV